jgi:hypothetical protein
MTHWPGWEQWLVILPFIALFYWGISRWHDRRLRLSRNGPPGPFPPDARAFCTRFQPPRNWGGFIAPEEFNGQWSRGDIGCARTFTATARKHSIAPVITCALASGMASTRVSRQRDREEADGHA